MGVHLCGPAVPLSPRAARELDALSASLPPLPAHSVGRVVASSGSSELLTVPPLSEAARLALFPPTDAFSTRERHVFEVRHARVLLECCCSRRFRK